jgi:Methyltransferase domain
MSMILELTAKLPPGVRQRLRGLVRLRWITKARTMRLYATRGQSSLFQRLLYVLWDPELDNFTYEIANEDELAGFVAAATGAEPEQVVAYIREAQEDVVLRGALRGRMRRRWDRKSTPHYGRRLGWYALARVVGAGLIVETGIHDGLGSALLLRALERNAADGKPGRLISVDVDPAAGWLVDERLGERWQPAYESTFTALPKLLEGQQVGMIIHDSDHTYECENFEFRQAVEHAAPQVALVSDNSHATSALRDVCRDLGIAYRYFQERPRDHFYPGAGIGFGFLERGGG